MTTYDPEAPLSQFDSAEYAAYRKLVESVVAQSDGLTLREVKAKLGEREILKWTHHVLNDSPFIQPVGIGFVRYYPRTLVTKTDERTLKEKQHDWIADSIAPPDSKLLPYGAMLARGERAKGRK